MVQVPGHKRGDDKFSVVIRASMELSGKTMITTFGQGHTARTERS
jgi:hypothetical protein